jgi:hypothetical protein
MDTLAHPSQPKFVRWAVVLAIIIVLNILFVVIRTMTFPAPQYSDFCTPALVDRPMPETQDACVSAGGHWNGFNSAPAPASVSTGVKVTLPTGYCDLTRDCQAKFDTAQKAYGQKAFALMTVLGVIAIVVGILPLGSSIVSSGLSYGGVVSLIIGSGQYWSEAGNWLRLVIALIALAILIFIGLKRFRD